MHTIVNSIVNKLLSFLFPESTLVRHIQSMNRQEFEAYVSDAKIVEPLTIRIADDITDFKVYTLYSYQHKIIKTVIHQVKYFKNVRLAKMLAEIVQNSLCDLVECIKLENPLVIPIPSHSSKKALKGFNQTELILGFVRGFEVKNVLVKPTKTENQTSKNKNERLTNLFGSFAIHQEMKEFVFGRNIIVFDDVVTTGATLLEARRVLLEAGAKSVAGVTVAH